MNKSKSKGNYFVSLFLITVYGLNNKECSLIFFTIQSKANDKNKLNTVLMIRLNTDEVMPILAKITRNPAVKKQ